MSQVDSVRTPFTPSALITALTAAYVAQLGHEPTHETTAVMCAQIALETANGADCLDWDVGNFKAAGGADFQAFKTWEMINGQRVEMVCDFAAFSSLESGLEAYLHAMYSHWTLGWAGAVKGDPVAFAHGLHDQKPYGYFTADPTLYAAGVSRWFAYYMARLGGDPSPTEPELPSMSDAAAMARDGLRVE